MYKVRILPKDIFVEVKEGEDLLTVQIMAGLIPDAPCGGQGTCGKCMVTVILPDETEIEVLACQYKVESDLVIIAGKENDIKILESGVKRDVLPDPLFDSGYAAAFDVGTTTVVCYLLNLSDGKLAAKSSIMNPQRKYGADVISRCEYAINNGTDELSGTIRKGMNQLLVSVCEEAKITNDQVKLITFAGNTCMHHLFLGIDPKPLTVVPYEAAVKDEIVMRASDADIKAAPDAVLQVLPNIAGFVGADTIGCLLATAFDKLEDLSLMIDIGTNGEMVMGNRDRMIACSTAAGPAFEGAKIDCGMRGIEGAIDHIFYDDQLICHVLGNIEAEGICGSGLLDAVAVFLDAEMIDETGKIDTDIPCSFRLPGIDLPAIRLTEKVYISQKDIREVQLAKGAIAAGIELMAEELGIRITDIKKVMIAGAFGNYMDAHSACRIGMIPAELEDRIEMIGNAAGEGSIIASLNHSEFLHAQELREKVEFLELASSPDFQDTFIDNLLFE